MLHRQRKFVPISWKKISQHLQKFHRSFASGIAATGIECLNEDPSKGFCSVLSPTPISRPSSLDIKASCNDCLEEVFKNLAKLYVVYSTYQLGFILQFAPLLGNTIHEAIFHHLFHHLFHCPKGLFYRQIQEKKKSYSHKSILT